MAGWELDRVFFSGCVSVSDKVPTDLESWRQDPQISNKNKWHKKKMSKLLVLDREEKTADTPVGIHVCPQLLADIMLLTKR